MGIVHGRNKISNAGNFLKPVYKSGRLGLIFLIGILTCSNRGWSPEFQILKHDLEIKLEPGQSTLIAKDKITIKFTAETTRIDLFLNQQLKVDSAFFAGRALPFKTSRNIKLTRYFKPANPEILAALPPLEWVSFKLPDPVPEATLEIFYHGNLTRLSKEKAAPSLSRPNQIIFALKNRSELLSGGNFWYPDYWNSHAQYQIAILTPEDYEAVTVGKLMTRLQPTPNSRLTTYFSEIPLPAISLLVGPYEFTPFVYGKIEMYTFLFPQYQQATETTQKAAARLLNIATQQIELFTQNFGDYAYPKCAIVAAPGNTSFTFPSVCVLDSSEMHLMNTSESRLKQLVAFNWFGQGIFNAPAHGDWSVGLVRYLTQHFFQEQATNDRTAEFRFQCLRDYSLNIQPAQACPLELCWNPAQSTHQWLNATRGMFLFYHLKNCIGRAQFIQNLKRCYQQNRNKAIDWEQFKTYFKWGESPAEMANFWNYWLKATATPQFSYSSLSLQTQGAINSISGTLNIRFPQIHPSLPYRWNFPMVVTTRTKSIPYHSTSDSTALKFKITLKEPPLMLHFDPDFQHFRHLNATENPPYIRQALEGTQKIFILPGQSDAATIEAYRHQIHYFLNENETPVIKFDRELTTEELRQGTLILFGGINENRIVAKFATAVPAPMELLPDGFTYQEIKYWRPSHALHATLRSPLNPARTLLIYWGLSPDAITTSAEEVRDLQNFSFIILRDGTRVTWQHWNSPDSP
ncbi:hypothetical protein L0128_08520, partial [candidate division KSB1 bacterium]|nr:hypothetical protein [candidate division KSB1 bacterium]